MKELLNTGGQGAKLTLLPAALAVQQRHAAFACCRCQHSPHTITWTDTRAGSAVNAINANTVANDTSAQSFTLTTRAFNNTTVSQ